MKIILTDSEKAITQNDVFDIENFLKIKLPKELVDFYFKFNGGDPNKTLFVDQNCQYEDIEIRDFFSFKYRKDFQDDPDFTIEGRAKSEWATMALPKNLLAFAIDWGGNYFCIDHMDGKIYYYVRDVWSENLSPEKNFLVNSKFLSESFNQFIDGLTFDDVDE